MARPAMPPTTAPAITPPDTASDFNLSLGDGIELVSGSGVAEADTEEDVVADSDDVDEEDVASALRESELKSNVRAVAEGSAEESEEKVSFIRLSGTFASGLSCSAWHTLIWPVEVD